jgi:hypothetical protein
MKKLAVLLVCCGMTVCAFASDSPTTAASFLGVWKLLRIEVRQPDGHITPDPDLGPHPIGYIFYDSSGHMGVQIMNPDRPKWKSDGEPTLEEARTSVTGYTAYSGTYDVHESEGYIVHHTEIGLDPNGVGRERKRKFRMVGGQLYLTPPPFKSPTGEMLDETLVWERVR